MCRRRCDMSTKKTVGNANFLHQSKREDQKMWCCYFRKITYFTTLKGAGY